MEDEKNKIMEGYLMSMRFKLLFLIMIVVYVYSYPQNTSSSTIKSIYQLSYYHGEFGQDSVVLEGGKDDEEDYYSKIDIFRKGKKIFELKDDLMELEGSQNKCFTQTSIKNGYYYIFEVNDRPLPNRFLVLKIEKDTILSLGMTKNSTAELFGDIDRDGKFEIGGFSHYNETKSYVFEIAPGFPVDKILTKKINEAKKESFKSKK